MPMVKFWFWPRDGSNVHCDVGSLKRSEAKADCSHCHFCDASQARARRSQLLLGMRDVSFVQWEGGGGSQNRGPLFGWVFQGKPKGNHLPEREQQELH